MKKHHVLFLLATVLLALPSNVLAQRFGGVLASTDHNIFVGEASNNAFPGSVYVYADNEKPGTWIEVDRLEPADGFGGDRFGQSLAASSGTLLIGMPGYDDGVGAVVVFSKNEEGQWEETSRITLQDGLPEDNFGRAIAMTDDMAAISAPNRDKKTGAVYLFERSEDDSWQQASIITKEEGAEGDVFGASLAMRDGKLLVGATGHNENKGTAVLFKQNEEGSWMQINTYSVEDADDRSQYAQVVALGQNVAYVGAPRHNNRNGAVFVFNTNTEAGQRIRHRTISGFDSHRNSQFGASILAMGEELWIGAPGNMQTGTVYQFSNPGPQGWMGVQKITGTDLSGRAGFGTAIVAAGNTAVFGATGIDGGEGAAMIFAKNEESGSWDQKLQVVNEVKGFDAITGADVKCENDKVADFDCKGVSLQSFLPIKEMGGGRGVRVNDIWGWTDPQTKKEYALIGRTDGTSFVDVTDPNMPIYVGQLSKTEGSRSSVWRDVKVYKDHAYIVADASGQHGMQVLDLTKLREYSDTPIDFEEDAIYDNIASAHNIVINEDTGFAYAVGSSSGGETCGGGLHMINIQSPKEPTFSGCFADTSTGRNKTGYSHDAQCVVYQGPDVDFQGKEICFGSNETALSIADVSDKENPKALSVVSYPKVVYTHQGWLTEDQRYFYMNDEGDEPTNVVDGTRTLVWDVSDLEDPILVKEHIAETTSTDHNLYIRGNLMYQSNYDSGFRILDISSPENPVEIGFLDTTPFAGGGGGSWSNYPYFESGTIIVTSMREGLFVVKKEDVAF